MSNENKELIRKLNKGFATDDTEMILSCLADDIHWVIAGFAETKGKDAFRNEIHNDAFEGIPEITIKNEIAEGNYVAVEGAVKSKMKGGAPFSAFFHNTYRVENGKVKAMTSYVVPEKLVV